MAVNTGLLAIYSDPDKLLNAVKKVRAKGIDTRFIETFTPFPIHGMEDAMGLKRSFIPWLTLIFGIFGCAFGYLFQTWTSAFDWALNVGGKPLQSGPAFIPITFETTVLFAGVLTFISLFLILKLPNRTLPPMDLRISDNRFGLFISGKYPQYDLNETDRFLKEDCQAEETVAVADDYAQI